MYILSDRAVKAIHEHRLAVAMQNRENAHLRCLHRKRRSLRRMFRPATSPRPVVRIAASYEASE